ncbi:MAG: hypothetical protein ACM3PW_06975 [Chlamydiota bacterium]
MLLTGAVLLALLTWGAAPSAAVVSSQAKCPGAFPISSFKLVVQPSGGGPALPVTAINLIQPGQKLHYEPVRLPAKWKDKAKVAVVLAPALADDSSQVEVLAPRPAKAAAEWSVPIHASVVGLVFGEHGIDAKRVNSLIKENPEIITQLADYAQRTTTVEALVQTLSNYEQSAPGSSDLQSALHGFSSQYGVAVPKLDSGASPDQAAGELLQAAVPAFGKSGSGDPPTLAAGSTGLAASVASMFFGSPVILAVGGTALFENLHGSLFPGMEFRPAFAQTLPADGMALCAANRKPSRLHVAYLWMVRVPDSGPPTVTLAQPAVAPLGWTPTLKASVPSVSQLRLVARARDWKLIGSGRVVPISVKVTPNAADDSLQLDLAHVKLSPGKYQLEANWDWTPLPVSGTVDVRPFADFNGVKLTPQSEDRLVAGTGTVPLQATGADFEFVKGVTLHNANQGKDSAKPVHFSLPPAAENGEKRVLDLDVNTASLQPGPYLLALTQLNGSAHEVQVTVHPPTPKITNLPLRVNVGEPQQTVQLQGSELQRITSISSPNAEWTLAAAGEGHLSARAATIKLLSKAQPGDRLAATVVVSGLNAPLQLSDAMQVLGPRPRIVNVNQSFAGSSGVQLQHGEIPSGVTVSFALRAENTDSRPGMRLECADDGNTRKKLTLYPGDQQGGADLNSAGQGVLFLSLDPGAVGQFGCELTATIVGEPTGNSDPYSLGHVVLLPRIEKFTISGEKLAPSLYAGTLTGQDLELIDRTGWNSKHGYEAQGIPTPVPGAAGEQTLKIAVPWPPPSPQAPLYIWLRGEKESRATNTRY